MFKIEHDTATGEIKEISLTATEIKEIAKTALLDRIGLTADELKTILG